MPERRRLDLELVRRGLAQSRHRAQQLVAAGAVTVGCRTASKPAEMVHEAERIEVADAIPYVGRGGLKLAAALDAFGLTAQGKVALDVGASTGGFTDCLLQRGARRVYAVDVGRGQLADRLRGDSHVVVIEEQDIRLLDSLPEPAELAVVDVSFISLRLVLPAVARLIAPGAEVVVLVKPQFEAGPGAVDGRGVLRDARLRERVVAELLDWLREHGWRVHALTPSPIQGGEGNVEYLAHLTAEDVAAPA